MKILPLHLISIALLIGCSKPTLDTESQSLTTEISINLSVADESSEIESRVTTSVDSNFNNPWITQWEQYDKVLLVGSNTSSTLSMSNYDDTNASFGGTIDSSLTSGRILYPAEFCHADGGTITINYGNVYAGGNYPPMINYDGVIDLSGSNISASMSHIGAMMDVSFSFTGLAESSSYQLIALTLDSGTANVYNSATIGYGSTTTLTTSDSRLSKGAINVSFTDMTVTNGSYSVQFNILPFEVANNCSVLLTATLLDSSGKIYTQSSTKLNTTGSTIYFRRGTHNYLQNVAFNMSGVTGQSSNWSGTSFSGGDGNTSTPYEISTAEELAYLSETHQANNNYKLTADINLAGKLWTPIGSNSTPFSGNFYGNGYSIYNLTIYSTDSSDTLIGLFGYAASCNIKGVNIASGTINTLGERVGGVVGEILSGNISDCHNGTTVIGSQYVGGIVGYASTTTVSTSSNSGYIYASSMRVGGIAGLGHLSDITECSNSGTIECKGSYHAGGIVGLIGLSESYCNVTHCYNSGSISAPSSVGGIAGRSYTGTTISSCYNIGAVTSTSSSNLGSIVGNNTGSNNITNCYSLESIAKGSGSDGEIITSTLVLFSSLSNGNSIWYQLSGCYPVLSWER